MQELQGQYDTALAAAVDFVLVASLGVTLQGLEQKAAELPLSEQDYLTLPARHAALVQRVTEHCRELAAGRHYSALSLLSAKQKDLKALDPSGNSETSNREDDGRDSSVQAPGSEGDGANDPVVISSTRD
jgi:hypothetical protein